MPAPALSVSTSATASRRGIAFRYDRGAIAQIGSPRCGKGRTRRAFHGAVGTRFAYRWRSGIPYGDGLGARHAGVPAIIYRVPAPALSVSPSATACRRGIAFRYDRGAIA